VASGEKDCGLHPVELGLIQGIILPHRDVQRVQVGIDVPEREAVRPIWILVPTLREWGKRVVSGRGRLQGPTAIRPRSCHLRLEYRWTRHNTAEKQREGYSTHGLTKLVHHGLLPE
jgi:hypothetical protein